ncbi:MAG: helix-turn-helix transcriptional regulator [Anaerolinea sp.]|nr:helix-turn-helix transcriptional regulator [Anaerolinea sp.]
MLIFLYEVNMRGDRVKELRERLQISQLELAERVGVSAQHIYRIESGRRDNPTAETLIRLSKEFGVSVDYLLGLVDDPHMNLQEADMTPEERNLLSAWRREDMRAILKMLSGIGKEENK